MLIEPRQAAPGAVLRWSRQALGLIARGFGFWLGLSLLFCLWMFLGQRLPLLDGILALTAFFASILVAARLDRSGRASLSDVLADLRTHGQLVLGFAVAIACAGTLIWMLVLAKPGVPWWNALYTERNVVRELSTDWFSATRQIFVYSAYALGLSYFGLNIPALSSFFQFPVAALYGVSWREAYRIGALAQIRNLPAMLGVGLLWVVLPVLCVLVAPFLVPMLYCFFAALCYVSFREIFLGVGENLAVADAVPRALPATR